MVKDEWLAALHLRRPGPEERSGDRDLVELVAGPVDRDASTEGVIKLIAHFSRLAGFSPAEREPGKPKLASFGDGEAAVVLQKPHPTALNWTNLEAAVRDVAGGGYEGDPREYFVLPALPSGDELEPLAIWWAVLFALSNLARYEPDMWVRALDVDRSRVAVHLEDCLAEALSVLPHLVLEAMLGARVTAHTYA